MENYQDAMSKLKQIDGIESVKDGSTGRVKAVDFKMFNMTRPTGASNFVFSRYGTSYENGLIRLPRVRKSNLGSKELREKILSSISSSARSCVEIRLEPEVDLEDDYHYPHIEINSDLDESVHIVESVSQNYRPPISN